MRNTRPAQTEKQRSSTAVQPANISFTTQGRPFQLAISLPRGADLPCCNPVRRHVSYRLSAIGYVLALLIALGTAFAPPPHLAPAAAIAAHGAARSVAAHGAARSAGAHAPRPAIEPYVRPGLAERMERLRPAILAAAQRHNRPALSEMSDAEFAAVIALVIYNENFGWLEDDIAPLRRVTPLYQELQRQANWRMPGSNFSVWPANLRPSVALEILNQELPLPENRTITVPITVAGSRIDPQQFSSAASLHAAINAEISRDDLAVAYLAANLERGLFRAAYEEAPVSWRTLAAWHNQGLIDPRQIRANSTARDYVRRASAYLPMARDLVAPRPAGRSLLLERRL
jgi:hypothetical protein